MRKIVAAIYGVLGMIGLIIFTRFTLSYEAKLTISVICSIILEILLLKFFNCLDDKFSNVFLEELIQPEKDGLGIIFLLKTVMVFLLTYGKAILSLIFLIFSFLFLLLFFQWVLGIY